MVCKQLKEMEERGSVKGTLLGRLELAKEIVLSLFENQKQMTIEQIAQTVGVSVAQVQEWIDDKESV